MAEKICKVCGTVLSDEDRFCPNCGAKVETAEEIAAEVLENNIPAEETAEVVEESEELGTGEPVIEEEPEETPEEPEEPETEEAPAEEEPKKETKSASETMKEAGETAKKAAATVGTAISNGAKAVTGSPITKNILTLYKDLWRDPAKTIEKFSKGDYFIESLIVTGFTSLLFVLLVLRLIARTGKNLSMMMYGFNFLNYIPASFYFSLFLIAVLTAFIFAGLMFVTAKFIYRRKYTFKDAFSSIGVAAAFLSCGLLVAILLTFLSDSIAMIVLLFTYVMAIIGLFISLLTVAECRPNQAMYSLAIVHVVGYLAVYALVYLVTANLLR
jgi:hypothetical protein